MNSAFSDILYKDSPFLPTIIQEHRDTVLGFMVSLHRPPIVAMSLTLCQIALKFNEDHQHDQKWIKQTFGIESADIDLFMFGYVMVPSLVLGTFIAVNKGIPEAVRHMCQKPTDDFLLHLNRYKADHLVECLHIYLSSFSNTQKCAASLYELCFTKPFSENKYFLAGIKASQINLIELDWVKRPIHQ